jgi:hypothetical protein
VTRPALWALALVLWTLAALTGLRAWEAARPRPQFEREPFSFSTPCRVHPEDFQP